MTRPTSPWSMWLRRDDVPADGRNVAITADASILPALARAAGVSKMHAARAEFDVQRTGDEGLHVTGRVTADVEQQCVVTLEPVTNRIDETIDLTFTDELPEAGVQVAGDEPGLDSIDPPDTLTNGAIDLGALATEFVVLGVDPYPRKPGVRFDPPAADDGKDNPFAALSALKGKSS